VPAILLAGPQPSSQRVLPSMGLLHSALLVTGPVSASKRLRECRGSCAIPEKIAITVREPGVRQRRQARGRRQVAAR